MIFALILGLLCIGTALFMLYMKYRVVLTGEKCTAQIVGIVDLNCGARVKKHAYIVKIGNEQYHTAHGCIFKLTGKMK